jgi:hypothetical protein
MASDAGTLINQITDLLPLAHDSHGFVHHGKPQAIPRQQLATPQVTLSHCIIASLSL